MKHSSVPGQHSGIEKDFSANTVMSNTEQAELKFYQAIVRIKNINCWHEYSGLPTASFQLTNQKGTAKKEEPVVGDYVRIDIAGPGPASGDGFDWVKIEEIFYERAAEGQKEVFSLRLRPAPMPGTGNTDTAHFFNENATSTFIAHRDGNVITVEYHGRNEQTNSEGSLLDKIRNKVVGIMALAALSDVQWKSLIEGFIA